LLCSHESVSAKADTIVDFPTPPFVFITAIVLRITCIAFAFKST